MKQLVTNKRTGRQSLALGVTVAAITFVDNSGKEVLVTRPLPSIMTIEEAKINTLSYIQQQAGAFSNARWSPDKESTVDHNKRPEVIEAAEHSLDAPEPRHVVIVDYVNGESSTAVEAAYVEFR